MSKEWPEGGTKEKSEADAKYFATIDNSFKDIGVKLSLDTTPKSKLIDGTEVASMSTHILARMTVDAHDIDEGVSLWGEMQVGYGFNTADRAVSKDVVAPQSHQALVTRRAEIMDKLYKKLGIEDGYEQLNPERKMVFLEANFVSLLSELADAYSKRAWELERELKVCKETSVK